MRNMEIDDILQRLIYFYYKLNLKFLTITRNYTTYSYIQMYPNFSLR